MTKLAENKITANSYNPQSCKKCKFSHKQFYTDLQLRHLECMHSDGNGFGWRYFMDVDYFKFGKPYWCPLDI